MTDQPRLIEFAFPLEQTSLDSAHEKNVRHGHISTLHIWPARRPLAACRAALIATLLPDPGTPEKRKELCEKIAGKVVKRIEKKKMPDGQTVEREKEETEGGILHWGRETENAETLEWFRQEIRKAYGGRAPKVLDPFAGGGAIPLEAMRLGCEATAIDINPVAWFILKCTLEYPQKLAGQKRPLPAFIVKNREFMEAFLKAQGIKGAELKKMLETLALAKDSQAIFDQMSDGGGVADADLAWHVRAWGQWVLDRARRELARLYPIYADFEPLEKDTKCYEQQPMQQVPFKTDGTFDIDSMNSEFSENYLAVKSNPRWVPKPTVAYLWARTVICKNCRAIVPLLKTRWLCKKDRKRVLLTIDVQDAPHMEVAQASVPVPNAPFFQYRRNLPHWRLEGATYFITWRLHAAQSELQPDERDLVLSALNHFDRQRYDLYAWVVMNDHVHVIVKPHAGFDLSGLTHSWKSFTANQLQRRFGRQGAVWQDESWDRIVRDEEEFFEKTEYILNNAIKRWPDLRDYRWVGCRIPEDEPQRGQPGMVATGVSAGSPRPPRLPKATSTGTEAGSTKRVMFGVETNVPVKGGNAAQKREHDKRIGGGTMSRAGAKCPCCATIMTMEDLRLEGKAGKLGSVMTAVVIDTPDSKAYRLPTEHELAIVGQASVPGNKNKQGQAGTEACPTITEATIQAAFRGVPFGVPDEPTPAGGGSGAGRAFGVQGYGLMKWRDMFTSRQLTALGTFVATTRAAMVEAASPPLSSGGTRRDVASTLYPAEWIEAVGAYLALVIGRTANYMSTVCLWDSAAEEVKQTFLRFALPITWDYAEANPMSAVDRYFAGGLSKVVRVLNELLPAAASSPQPTVINQSAIVHRPSDCDLVVTDPPYYDAIPYSDLMDFFYIWLRRSLNGESPAIDAAFAPRLSPKWNHDANDGELIDDSSRHENNAAKSKKVYEDGMARAFLSCAEALKPDGRLVIVFANKQPAAWETLVSALIRSGFVVDGSWPIATEMRGGVRNFARASLASSVWLVCKKRPATARPGWDNKVLDDMRANIGRRLREFWDAGIRGPDFVWAATGPALEAYSKHPVVKMANEPNSTLSVTEFLNHARRMVVDFVVGRVLGGGDEDAAEASVDRLDETTAYYLLHRNDFGLDDAPVGACILYAMSCGLSDQELVRDWDLLAKTGDVDAADADDEDADADGDDAPADDAGSGGKLKLKPWNHRRGRSLGIEATGGRPVPLIDRIHRLMHLWKGGDVHKVDEYLDEHGLRRHELFRRVLQSLIELAKAGAEERSLLESLSNHIGAKGAKKTDPQIALAYGEDE